MLYRVINHLCLGRHLVIKAWFFLLSFVRIILKKVDGNLWPPKRESERGRVSEKEREWDCVRERERKKVYVRNTKIVSEKNANI